MIIQRVAIYSKALVVEYGEVDKDLGVGEGENLLRKIDSFFKKVIFSWRKLLYNVVLVSAIQQCKSAISVHVSPAS